MDPVLIPGGPPPGSELEHLAAGGDTHARNAARAHAREPAEVVQARKLDESARNAELAEEHAAERRLRGQRRKHAPDRPVGLRIALAGCEAERVDAKALLGGGQRGDRPLDGAIAGDHAPAEHADQHPDRGGDPGGDQQRPARVPAQPRRGNDKRCPDPPAQTASSGPRARRRDCLAHLRAVRRR